MQRLFASLVDVFSNSIINILDHKPITMLLLPTNYGEYAIELHIFEKAFDCDFSSAKYYTARLHDERKIVFVGGTKGLSKDKQQYDLINCNDKDVFIVVMDNFILNDVNYLFRNLASIIRSFLINNYTIKTNSTTKAKMLSIAPEVLAIKIICSSRLSFNKLENVDKDYLELIRTNSIYELFAEGKILTGIKK